MWLEADGDKLLNLDHVREIRTEPVSGGSILVAIFTNGDRDVLRQFKAQQDALSVLRGHFIDGHFSGKVLTLPAGQA